MVKTRNLVKLIREENEKEVESLATFVHGSLCALHTLSLFYNLRRRNYKDSLVHGLVATYDLFATLKHYRRVK